MLLYRNCLSRPRGQSQHPGAAGRGHLQTIEFTCFSGPEKTYYFYNTSSFVSALENRQGLKIACLEEIAFNYNWINKKQIADAIKFYGNCLYSQYLKKILK